MIICSMSMASSNFLKCNCYTQRFLMPPLFLHVEVELILVSWSLFYLEYRCGLH